MATLHRLILASGSFGRRELLKYAGYQFEVLPSNIDEHDGTGVTDPRRYVAELAWQKAAAVASLPAAKDSLILAADSTVWHQNQIIGKPVDEADARVSSAAWLARFITSGQAFAYGVSAMGTQVGYQELSELYFKALTSTELDHLIATKVWDGKAGGYGIESHGDPFLTVRTGTISNVIGLPMESLAATLKWFAPELLPK